MRIYITLLYILDGKVAGGPCLWHQDCDSSLGLFCDHPDGYPSENSRCQCISGVPDHFGRHCLDTSITIDGGNYLLGVWVLLGIFV